MRAALLALALLAAPSASELPDRAPAPPGRAADARAYFTEQEVAEFHAFHRPRWLRAFADQLVQLALFGALVGLRFDKKLKSACDRAAARVRLPQALSRAARPLSRALALLWGDESWAGAVLFALAYFGLLFVIELPQDIYFDYLQLKAHGLSAQTPSRHAALLVRQAIFSAAALSLLVFGLYGLARRTRRWWLLLGAPSALLIAALGLVDPLRAQLDYRFTLLPPGPTREAIEQALGRAGVAYQGLYQLDAGQDTLALDALVLGQGPLRRIALYDTLLRALTPREAAAVVAHELGHLHEDRSLRLWLAALSVVPLLALLALTLRALGRTGRFGFAGDHDVTSLPAAMLLFWLLFSLAGPLSQADSRAREARADAYALELLRDPEAFRAAMIKVARSSKADLTPPALVVALLYSHPPPLARIAAAEEWARLHGVALLPVRSYR